ncbi:hypothetical protein [Erwinia rhapontici]|nr:hypothetical protein [Erwinia rhapontici]
MSTIAPVELEKAYRLINHGPTILVSARDQGLPLAISLSKGHG